MRKRRRQLSLYLPIIHCTDETFTADLSVAINAPFYYAGEMKGPALVKYNQLSRISEELFDAAVYAGSKLK